jgi:predicted Holliday junction resolvase-like endonuclease
MTELFEQFQEFRKILCVCPCCGKLVRVSDLRLKAKDPAIRTWLDDYEKKVQELGRKEEQFEEIEEELREKAREKGRKKAEKIINNAISPSLKSLKFNPFDVKPIFNPVDFVVFKGMNKEDLVSDIILLSKKYESSPLNLIRHQIDVAIQKKRYEWQVARIDDRGSILFE